MIHKFSLPVIPNEKICSDSYSVNSFQDDLATGKGPKSFKVKIKCAPLNFEKIIEYEGNKIIKNKILRPTKVMKKRETQSSGKNKTVCHKKSLRGTKKYTAPISLKNKSLAKSRKTTENAEEKASVKNFKLLPKDSSLKKKRKSLLKESRLTSENISFDFSYTTQQTNIEEQNFEINTSEESHVPTSTKINNSSEAGISSNNLNVEIPSTEGFSCPFCILNNESAFLEITDSNLEEHLSLEVCCEELGMKSEENANEKNKKAEDILTGPNTFEITNDLNYCRHKCQSSLRQGDKSNFSKPSLQTAVETFMKNPQIKYLKGGTVLKKGLCFTWLSNYGCSNQQCPYGHNALDLFTKKLKQYPCKFIMTVVVSMRNDLLFVDVVLAALKVISERKIPIVWVTFLTFFVFYVTEPSDSRFLKFWTTAARFFCDLKKTYSACSGFASLLSIFSQGKNSEEWKIIEFIKLIRHPPVQVPVTFALLQPVLKMNLPSELLAEAVKSCIATQSDVLEVYSLIVPKISVTTSPIEIVELLLGLCKILEEMNHKNFSDNLKQRLREKILSFKTKVPHQKYPLVASFQEEILVYPNEVNCRKVSDGLPKEKPETTLDITHVEKNYFDVEDNICNVLVRRMELSTDTIPSPYRNTEDVCARQLNRIKQFFHDCQFDLLGKYLNNLKLNVVERAAEEFLKLLFEMKMSLQQGVDLIRIILLPCKSENAAKVAASISLTFIVNLIRINEWEKAYGILSLCQEKQINLVEGKVFHTNEFNTITQCRIILLLIEIQDYKGNYANAIDLVKKYFLFSSNTSLWQFTWKPCDEPIRVRILEDLLGHIVLNELTEAAYDLFGVIWKEQKQLHCSVDLRKFVNEVLILLLNENREEAVTLYEEFRVGVQLCDATIRALVVSMVRLNRLSAAKSLVLSPEQNVYFITKMSQSSGKIKILSFWLEEEIFVMFSTFFDLLTCDKPHFNPACFKDLEVDLQESKPLNMTALGLRPLCLSIIKSTLKDACERIQRVLEHQFSPPLKLIVMPYSLKLDELSLKLYLEARMCPKLRQVN